MLFYRKTWAYPSPTESGGLMNQVLLLISFLILSPYAFAQTPTQQASLRDLGSFLKLSPSKEKEKTKPSKDLKQKKIKNKSKSTTIIKKQVDKNIKKQVDKKSITKSNHYRKVSSKKIQRKLNRYIEQMADPCNTKYKTRRKRLNLFRKNIINLRTYLKTIINSSNVHLDQQMESKDIYNQIKEENFPALAIMEEDVSVKEKASTLKSSFKSFYMHYYNRKENDINYESWAKMLITGIDCINNQPR